jgi:hypothetical protein
VLNAGRIPQPEPIEEIEDVVAGSENGDAPAELAQPTPEAETAPAE